MENSSAMAVLRIDDMEVELPVVVGTEGERAFDISELRKKTGLVTLDPSLTNTAVCLSRITYVDGENGILRYRGIPIEDLVEKCSFVDVAYLLVHGALPDVEERKTFSALLNRNSLMHED